MSALLSLQRRQQLDHHHQYQNSTSQYLSNTSSPLQSNSLPLRIHNTQYLAPVPSEADIARLSHSPLSTIESSPATSNLDYDTQTEYYMPKSSQGLQQRNSSQETSRHQSLETLGSQQGDWGQHRSVIGQSISPGTSHKRTNSDSTIHSAPYTPVSFAHQNYPTYIADSELLQYSPFQEGFDHHSQAITSYPKNYHQVSQPIEQSNLYAQEHSIAYYNHGQNQSPWNNELMRQALVQQQQQQQQQQYQQRQQQQHQYQQQQFQGQIYHDMDNQGETNGSIRERLQPDPLSKVPSLDRSISAVYEDELYNISENVGPTQPSIPISPMVKSESNSSSHANSVLSRIIHVVNQSHLEAARSGSPTTTSFSRDRSPFRPNLVLPGSNYELPTSPGPSMNTAAKIREKQQSEAAANALANAARKNSRENSQTVSPKEVSLEYEPPENDHQVGLFGNPTTPPRHGQYQKRPSGLKQELTRNLTYDNLLKTEESSTMSNESVNSTGSQHVQIPQHYPFIRNHRSSASGIPESSQDSDLRFPTNLVSMESTRSERSESGSSGGNSPTFEQDASDQEEEIEDVEIQRPKSTRSDGGTYSCTYHGCTRRFETPQKLQKHKKEGHRQGSPSTNVDTRLTQAGPHKCERLNPQTGKPCNSIFSRPYDLTRHEDTIHNARKQKVKCMICTEDKTFSRNDALTRHMRVVHPEIEFPGKTKRSSR